MSGADFDFSEFLNFANNFHKNLQEEAFIVDVMNQLGNAMIRGVKKNTPVGQYSKDVEFKAKNKKGETVLVSFTTKTKKQGGNLRKQWHLDGVSKQGDSYIVTISNNTEYAGYVENGHRTVSGGWVDGQFFLKITMDQIMQQLPKIVGPMYRDYLRGFGFS